jgi:hypothetical protein
MLKVSRCAVLTLLVWTMASRPCAADDRAAIATGNIVGQAAVTLISAALRGNVRSRADVVRCLAVGAAAGAGMYKAKSLVGTGYVTGGWILGNVAGSLSENVIAGRRILSQIGYSIGPLRVRVSVPGMDPSSDSHVAIDLSVFESVSLVLAGARHDRVEFRSGMIAFSRDSPYNDADDLAGWTAGIFPGVYDRDDETWRHEVIHAVQFLQLDQLEPLKWPSREATMSATPKQFVRFGDVSWGIANGVNLLVLFQPYDRRWFEVEASSLVK